MELSQLRYFLAVSETLNYTKAAERCLISRQAMRQALRALECEIGATLVQNSHNHLSLTKAGTTFAQEIKPAVSMADEALRHVKALACQHVSLNVAYPATFFPFLLPSLRDTLSDFSQAFPNINIVEHMAANDAEMHALVSSELPDLALNLDAENRSEYSATTLITWDIGISMSKNNPLATRKELSLRDVSGMELTGFANTSAPILQAAERAGIPLRFSAAPDVITALHAATHEGAGFIDVIPYRGYSLSLGLDSVVVPLSGFTCDLLMYANDNATHPEHVQLLKDFLIAQCNKEDDRA